MYPEIQAQTATASLPEFPQKVVLKNTILES
jgi:hypothetical protein